MEELKRCPFCGGEAIEVRSSESYWVRCLGCDATGPSTYTEEEAWEAWFPQTSKIKKKW